MLETFGVALTTFFATIGPFDVAAVFAGLTASVPSTRRRQMAVRGTTIAAGILVLFALIGEVLLSGLGISLAALRTAGGVLLLLMGIDMVFARNSGGTSTTDAEEEEARTKQDISVFPLATPLIAGPGAMGAAILIMTDTEGDLLLKGIVIGSILLVLLATLIMLLLSGQIHRVIGNTGMRVVSRIMGVLLSALAVQFVFDGIAQSGLLAAG